MVGGEVTPRERSALEMALEETYAALGIQTAEKVAPILEKYNAPLLANIYHVLETKLHEADLAQRLRKYVEGHHLSGLFDRPTNVELDNRLVVFNIQKIENKEAILPIIMFIITNFVWHKIEEYPKDKKILVLDEAWRLLQNVESARFVSSLVRRARKRWLGVTVISQHINDFAKEGFGDIVLSQSATKILLKQDDTVLDKVQEVFHLSEEETNVLKSSLPGEAILIADRNHISLKVEASPEEHPLITTHPQERYEIDRNKAKQEEKVVLEGRSQPK